MLDLGSTARAHTSEILRALAESLTSEQDGMQASSHPRLLANCPASPKPRRETSMQGFKPVFFMTASPVVLKQRKDLKPPASHSLGIPLGTGSPQRHAQIPARGTHSAQVCLLLMLTSAYTYGLVPPRTYVHAVRHPHAHTATLLTHVHTHPCTTSVLHA